jgi:hypothetical protein
MRFVFLLAALAASAQDSPEAFFETKIRPVLVGNCYVCHTGMQSGGLRLDSREAVLKGGKSGPAVVPGKPDESVLLQAARHAEGRPKMPPAGRLSDDEIRDLTTWVREGAVWPAVEPVAVPSGPAYTITPQQRAFWSFQPVKKTAPPKVRLAAWSRNPIDAFVLAKLDEKKIAPAAAAAKLTLIRRASYDLLGLPPAPDEIDRFLNDKAPDAFAKLVDRLLASPRYGERSGRHWMDVVRYADTSGDASDYPIPQAAQYRDYIIAAFNKDKPYDQFLREQIAGDLLPSSNEDERWERIVATGYIASSRRFNVDPTLYWHMTYDDTVDNLGKVVLGLTIACARCHDHKFDPISNRDYYAMYGIFSSSRYPFPGSEKNHRQKDLIARVPSEYEKIMQPYLAEIYKLSGRIGKLEGEKRAYVDKGDKNRMLQHILDEIERTKAQRAPLLENMPKVEMAYAMTDAATPAHAKIQIRGDHKQLGEEVPRGFLSILGGQTVQDTKKSGRLELAQWLTDPANPLTARVMVNRIWQFHFGRGIVSTPSDFGKRGTAPTHPELLDYLAARFVESGWSIKAMHRLMMNSMTYQLASEGSTASAAADGANEFFWKYSRRRLDAEQIRDSLLAASGEMEWGAPGPHPFPHMATWIYMQHGPFADVYESNRRGVYVMTQRIQRHPYFGLFDGADPAISVAQRPLTISPVQALYSMNSEFVHARSKAWAERLLKDGLPEKRMIANAHRTLLGREPSADELDLASTYLASLKVTPSEALASYLRVLAASNQFLFVE